MKEQYQTFKFQKKTLNLIALANQIINEYQAQGFELTVRQIYYQFVARDLFPEDRRWIWTGHKWKRDPNGTKNADPNYTWLGAYINKGRMAGLIDWNAIVDRTRTQYQNTHWDNPEQILQSAASGYRLDSRATQDIYIEVWIEKNALLGVIEPVCRDLDVTFLPCIGYYSLSAMWRAAQRIMDYDDNAVILHLGDHDPSGIDMTRDIQERLEIFGTNVTVKRIALNMDQVRKYKPPPNPAKLSDSRAQDYVAKHGAESWELDALSPSVIAELIRKHVVELTDEDKRQEQIELQEEQRVQLEHIADNWENL